MSDYTNSGERVEGANGLRIFYRSLRPKEKPRAVVVIVPGFNAHSGYYTWVAEQFVASGLAVYAVDLRGRGNSDGERFYVENFEDYADDVDACCARGSRVRSVLRIRPACTVWYWVDFDDEKFGGYTVRDFDCLVRECRFLDLAEQPLLLTGKDPWIVTPGSRPKRSRDAAP